MADYADLEQTVVGTLQDKLTTPAGVLFADFVEDVCAKMNVTDKWEKKSLFSRLKTLLECEPGKYLVCGGRVFSCPLFFNHTRFRVVPTRFELDNGVLLAGANFAPFCPLIDSERGLLPSDLTIVLPNGQEAEKMTIEADYPDVEKVYYMLGKSEMIDTFSGEDERNRVSMMNSATMADVHLILPAFNMKSFYEENKLYEGDALVVEVQDWDKGLYSVQIQPRENAPDESSKDKFVRFLEQALLKGADSDFECNSICEQITIAYAQAFADGNDLRFTPWVSISEYRNRMCEMTIFRDGPDWTLVPLEDEDGCGDHCGCHDHDHGHEDDNILPAGMSMDPDITLDGFSVSAGNTGSLVDILYQLDAPLNAIEIASMIFSDISSGNESEDAFYDELTETLGLHFVDEAQEVIFHNYMDELWEQCYEAFVPMEDADRSEMRDRLIEIVTDRLSVEHDLKLRYDGKPIPKTISNKLTQIRGKISDLLGCLLNRQYEIVNGDGLYNQLLSRVDDVEDEWDRFVESLDEN